MNQLNLRWEGPFKIDVQTPEWAEGKQGLFVITHDTNLIYIGKAQGKNAVFKEAKNRENKWIKCLKKKVVTPNIEVSLSPYNYIKNHCQIFVGIMSGGQRLDLLDEAEKLLIYRMKPICNIQHKKKYCGISPFIVINEGNPPRKLPERIRYS
jgi:hypothetical protein